MPVLVLPMFVMHMYAICVLSRLCHTYAFRFWLWVLLSIRVPGWVQWILFEPRLIKFDVCQPNTVCNKTKRRCKLTTPNNRRQFRSQLIWVKLSCNMFTLRLFICRGCQLMILWCLYFYFKRREGGSSFPFVCHVFFDFPPHSHNRSRPGENNDKWMQC